MGSVLKAVGGLLGLSSPKIDDGGAAARAEESRRQAEAAAQNLQKNFAQDLKQENVAQVEAAGSGAMVDSTLKKKKVQNLSTSLGINV